MRPKGKARPPYEFGVKVAVATTHKEGLVVGMRSWPIPATVTRCRKPASR